MTQRLLIIVLASALLLLTLSGWLVQGLRWTPRLLVGSAR